MTAYAALSTAHADETTGFLRSPFSVLRSSFLVLTDNEMREMRSMLYMRSPVASRRSASRPVGRNGNGNGARTGAR